MKLLSCVTLCAFLCIAPFGVVRADLTLSNQVLGTTTSVAVVLGDIDGDGDLDALIQDGIAFVTNDATVTVWENLQTGSGVFSETTQVLDETTNLGWSLRLGDVDGDGDPDMILSTAGVVDRTRIWLNSGDHSGTFVAPEQATGTYGNLRDAGDVDGDTDLDLLYEGLGSPPTVYVNDGVHSGAYSKLQSLGTAEDAASVRDASFIDVEGDGDLDVYVAYNGADRLYVNSGTGPSPFSLSPQTLSSEDTIDVAAADVDGDGDSDLIMSTKNQAVQVWLNQGVNTGTFADSNQRLGSVGSLTVGDFDSDGDTDFLLATSISTRLYTNGGYNTGIFTNTGTPIAMTAPGVTGDFDDDGDLDVLAAKYQTGVWILTNAPDPLDATAVRNHFTGLDTNADGVLSLEESRMSTEDYAAANTGGGLLSMGELLAATVGPVGVSAEVWVDFSYRGAEAGTEISPFDSLLEATTFVQSAGTVRIAGTSAETIRIEKSMQLLNDGELATIGSVR